MSQVEFVQNVDGTFDVLRDRRPVAYDREEREVGAWAQRGLREDDRAEWVYLDGRREPFDARGLRPRRK